MPRTIPGALLLAAMPLLLSGMQAPDDRQRLTEAKRAAAAATVVARRLPWLSVSHRFGASNTNEQANVRNGS